MTCKLVVLLVSLFALASAGPPTRATVGSYTDPSCTQPSPAKTGLSNPAVFASLCTYYASGPPLSGTGGVSITFQSCTNTEAKLNSWTSSSASCIGIPTSVLTYVAGVCTPYTDTGGMAYYYKVICAPASALCVSFAAILASAFLFFIL